MLPLCASSRCLKVTFFRHSCRKVTLVFIGIGDKSKWLWGVVNSLHASNALIAKIYEKEDTFHRLRSCCHAGSSSSCLPCGSPCWYHVQLLLKILFRIRCLVTSTSSDPGFWVTCGKHCWHWQKQEVIISINVYVAWNTRCWADTNAHSSACRDFREIMLTCPVHPEEFYCTCKLLILLLLSMRNNNLKIVHVALHSCLYIC